MERDISPEEKLLRLIKHRPRNEDKAAAQTEGKLPQPRKDATPSEETAFQVSKELPSFKKITIINRIFFILFIILILYFLIDYFFLQAVRIKPGLVEEAKIDETIKKEPVKHPYSYYEKEIIGKDLFKPLDKDLEGKTEAEQEDDGKIEEISANLSLLGVVSGANPQAIIEDKKMGKTYFLNKNDSIGDIKLKEILEKEGRVILIYKGKEFSLGI